MRITLFKHSQVSFIQALDKARVRYEEEQPVPSQKASGALITIAQTAAVSGAIATVLVAWLRARASRKVILTLQDKRIIHLE